MALYSPSRDKFGPAFEALIKKAAVQYADAAGSLKVTSGL
jgi:hypothetical protein